VLLTSGDGFKPMLVLKGESVREGRFQISGIPGSEAFHGPCAALLASQDQPCA